jgi:hypothetical protein
VGGFPVSDAEMVFNIFFYGLLGAFLAFVGLANYLEGRQAESDQVGSAPSQPRSRGFAVWEAHEGLLEGALRGLAQALNPEAAARPTLTLPTAESRRSLGAVDGMRRGRAVRVSIRSFAADGSLQIVLCCQGMWGVPPFPIRGEGLVAASATGQPTGAQRLLADPDLAAVARSLLGSRGVKTLELGPEAELRLDLKPSAWREALRERDGQADADEGQRAADHLLDLLDQLVRLVDAAERVGANEASDPLGLRVAPRAVGGGRCPFCRDDVHDGEGRACPRCGTAQHADCWDEAGGCTTLGCRGRAASRGRVR